MSTKIYDAYRIKDSAKVWQVLAEIRERGQQEVVDRLRAFYVRTIEDIDPDSAAYRSAKAKDPKRGEVALRLDLAEDKLRAGAMKSMTSMQRDEFDLDVDVAMTWHETGYYLRAFCDPVSLLGGSLDFLKTHPELDDFSYQNQSDAPPAFADRLEEWAARGRIWGEMMAPPRSGMFKNQVVVEISNWTSFWYLNPCLDLRREFHENPPMLPAREEVLARVLRGLSAVGEVTAEAGVISGLATDGTTFTVMRATKRSQKKQWISTVDGATKAHPSLNRAVNRITFRYMEGYVRRMYEGFRREANQKKQADHARRRAGRRVATR